MRGALLWMVIGVAACAHQPKTLNDEDAHLQLQIEQYDAYSIADRLNTLVFRVNALERGIYLIQKAVQNAKDWDTDKKMAVCIAAGKKVRPENVASMKAIVLSLSDEMALMNPDQQSAYEEYRRRVWAIQPGIPLC